MAKSLYTVERKFTVYIIPLLSIINIFLLKLRHKRDPEFHKILEEIFKNHFLNLGCWAVYCSKKIFAYCLHHQGDYMCGGGAGASETSGTTIQNTANFIFAAVWIQNHVLTLYALWRTLAANLVIRDCLPFLYSNCVCQHKSTKSLLNYSWKYVTLKRTKWFSGLRRDDVTRVR